MSRKSESFITFTNVAEPNRDFLGYPDPDPVKNTNIVMEYSCNYIFLLYSIV